MREFTIFKRLTFGYLLVLVVVIVLGVYATLRLQQLNQIARSITSVDSEVIRVANIVRDAILSQSGFEKKYLISKDRDFYRQFLETETLIANSFERMAMLMDTPRKQAVLAAIRDSYTQYFSLVEKEKDMLEGGTSYPKKRYQEKKEDMFDQISLRLDEMIEMAKVDTDRKVATSERIGSQALKLTVTTIIAVIMMALVIAFFNARTINKPILRLMKGTKEIAEGKFEEHLRISSPPEIRELANAFNLMYDRLKEVDEMKADLISHVSHELRTPLTAIREAANLLVTGA